MELTASLREAKRKSDAKKVRLEGGIPAILYSKGEKGKDISVSDAEFQKLMRSIPKGTLSSKVITLKLADTSVKVIVKGIQYHPTTYKVLHLDLQELHAGEEVNVKIPLICTGVLECAGIKLGGVLRQVIFSIPVRTEPKNIPDRFTLNVQEMEMGHSRKLQDISIPKGVRPLIALKEVAVVIAKR